ncbi:MAG: glycosyltransferase family 4 protein [Desulfomicrobium sp.]
MRILIVHNHYGNYAVGGESMVMRTEAELLSRNGHDVFVYERTNDEISKITVWGKIKAFKNICWSSEGYDAVAAHIEMFKPDIMHVHNYKFLLSPSIFKAAKDRNVATCLTLHNYRLVCPAGQFLRNGKVCEKCLSASPYRMLFYRCSSNDLIKNCAQFYLYQGTRNRKFLAPWVDAYIALTSFGKSKFITGGIPKDRIFVKPNFVNVSCYNNSMDKHGAIYIGRLSKEKGLDLLLKAWNEIDYPIDIVGSGPLERELQRNANGNIKFHGQLEHEKCIEMIRKSAFLIFPSVCYEGFPLTILESFANATPVIASDLGPRREMIQDGVNGFLYPPNDIDMLREKVCSLIESSGLCQCMGENAKNCYLNFYSAEKNYDQLMTIYESAIDYSSMRMK